LAQKGFEVNTEKKKKKPLGIGEGWFLKKERQRRFDGSHLKEESISPPD